MDIKRATYYSSLRTKQELLKASNTRCHIRATVGELGSLSLDLWTDDLNFANIDITDVDEMRLLANLLNAIADAQFAQNISTDQ